MIYAANWKMNGNTNFVNSILSEIKQKVIPHISSSSKIIICPPSIYLGTAVKSCKNTPIEIGAQDCSSRKDGAYTGEISADMISDVGSDWLILGHSERRQYHNENNSQLYEKLLLAQLAGLKVIFCVGETHKQYLNGETEEIIMEQLSVVCESNFENLDYIIAYEPVWAIGTGLVPKIKEINLMHQFIKSSILKNSENKLNVQVIYGGSVSPKNANQLKSLSNVDGVLVGGASLDPEKFKQICL